MLNTTTDKKQEVKSRFVSGKNLLLTLTTLAIICLSNLLNAQAPSWLWAKSAGGFFSDSPSSLATDANGNVYMTGIFESDSITFGTTTLSNVGGADIFIVKYDSIGNVLWAKSTVSAVVYNGTSIATDASGNVFMTGSFNGDSITFGTTTLINTDSSDIFIVKYDASGNVLWARSEGGTDDDASFSVATDASGNVFITGAFSSDSITFGTTTLINQGNYDIFIAKYDASGNVLWAKSAGGTSYDNGLSVATDASGNVFITGGFYSPTITFGTITLVNDGLDDFYIVKCDASGNMLWAKSAGGTSYDRSNSVATDASGNVFMSGLFVSDSITFGTITLTHAAGNNNFIVKYDTNGNVLWAKNAGGYGSRISTDANGNVFRIGYFQSSNITFGTFILTNAGQDDIFMVKYDGSGNVLWAKSAGGWREDYGNCIAIDANGNVFIAGAFQSITIPFGTTTLTNASYPGGPYAIVDIFIAKIDTAMTTGIESVENAYGISIYPNPAKDELTISNSQWAMGKVVTITITDITGKIICTTTSTSPQKTEVNISNFAEGVYLVQVQTVDFMETRKVIVAK